MTVTVRATPDTERPFNDQLARISQRIAGRLEQGFYSQFKGYGLQRDLGRPLEKPVAKIPLSVRPLREDDLDILLPMEGDIPSAEMQQIRWRRHFYKKTPYGCFVAVDQRTDTPCYLQWLISSDQNEHLSTFKCFPRLAKTEALMEQAYTVPSHRGLGIMSAAMAEIAEKAEDFGARYVLTFVGENGIASLKACKKAGFFPHLLHRRTQIAYGIFVHNHFKKIAANDPLRNPAL